MVHGTFKEVTHMASLHARIPPDTIAMLQLAATCIDIHALSLHIGYVHSRSCRDSLVNQTQVFAWSAGLYAYTLHCVANTNSTSVCNNIIVIGSSPLNPNLCSDGRP